MLHYVLIYFGIGFCLCLFFDLLIRMSKKLEPYDPFEIISMVLFWPWIMYICIKVYLDKN